MKEFQRVLAADPDSVSARHCAGTVYARQGLYDQAIAQFQKAARYADRGRNIRALAHTLATVGRAQEANRVLSHLKIMSATMPPGTDLHWNLALVYAGLGQKDKAFVHLTNAYEEDERSLAVPKVEPLVDNLRADPRFEALLRRIGLT